VIVPIPISIRVFLGVTILSARGTETLGATFSVKFLSIGVISPTLLDNGPGVFGDPLGIGICGITGTIVETLGKGMCGITRAVGETLGIGICGITGTVGETLGKGTCGITGTVDDTLGKGMCGITGTVGDTLGKGMCGIVSDVSGKGVCGCCSMVACICDNKYTIIIINCLYIIQHLPISSKHIQHTLSYICIYDIKGFFFNNYNGWCRIISI